MLAGPAAIRDQHSVPHGKLLQRQIQDFPKGGGVGCRGYGYFILGLSVVGHIMRCTDKMSVDKILGDQTPVKTARGGGTKCCPFYGTGRAKCLS